MRRAKKPELTDREKEVVDLVGRGCSDHEISNMLDIAHSTVRSHLENIAAKLAWPARAGRPRPAIWKHWHNQLIDPDDDDSVPAWIYFVRAGEVVKIGVTIDPFQRYKNIASTSPLPVTLVGYIQADPAEEDVLHERFADLRLHGEWFRLEGELESYLAETFGASPWERDVYTYMT